jgi:hypothetical protein
MGTGPIAASIKLTKSQERQLQKYFDVVDVMYAAGEKGMLLAQVIEDRGDGAMLRVAWLCEPMARKMCEALPHRGPCLWPGLPNSI